MFCNIVHKECTSCITIVSISDGSNLGVTGCVPYLSHDELAIDRDGFVGELDSDGGVEFESELVVTES